MGRGPSPRLSASFVVRSYDGGCAEFDSSWLGFPFSRFGAVFGVKRMAHRRVDLLLVVAVFKMRTVLRFKPLRNSVLLGGSTMGSTYLL